MNSHKALYTEFRRWVPGPDDSGDLEDNTAGRVAFFLLQYKMIPPKHKRLFANLIGGIQPHQYTPFWDFAWWDQNIARFSVVQRLGAHRTQSERSGAFYHFIAPSHFGKGVALSVIEIASHIEEARSKRYVERLGAERRRYPAWLPISLKSIMEKSMELRPRRVFLTGSNGIQAQARAAQNAGSGFIMVPEIKSDKERHTDFETSYAPLLCFYDTNILANLYRKADTIAVIKNCRIQLHAAGVKEDYIQFICKSGPTLGSLARVIPFLAYDRKLLRLQRDRLPAYTFCLTGMNTAYGIIESHFGECSSNDLPTLTVQFSSSALMDSYRSTNDPILNLGIMPDQIYKVLLQHYRTTALPVRIPCWTKKVELAGQTSKHPSGYWN